MKRFVLVLLALLLLSACGQITPEPGDETTIEAITTAEASFVPTEGEANEISWRTLDVNSAEGREINAWLAEQWEEYMHKEYPSEYPMGDGAVVVKQGDSGGKIVLRDKNGKETTLLDKVYLGEETTPEEMREEAWKVPRFAQALDDRYFVYEWGYWEGSGEPGVYDTKEMREIPIAYGAEYAGRNWCLGQPMIFGSALYLREGSYGPYGGPLSLMRVDLSALDSLKENEPLQALDVLADIPGVEDVMDMNSRFVSEDERYFVLNDIPGLRVYDLQQKKLLLQLPVSIFGPGAEQMAWGSEIVPHGNIMYWMNRHSGGNYLAEITLP